MTGDDCSKQREHSFNNRCMNQIVAVICVQVLQGEAYENSIGTYQV